MGSISLPLLGALFLPDKTAENDPAFCCAGSILFFFFCVCFFGFFFASRRVGGFSLVP